MARPTEHSEAKRAPVSLRTTPQLRDKIVAAAEMSGRSLAQEVELRLERSFAMEADAGDAATRALIDFARLAANLIHAKNGKTWIEDAETGMRLRGAITNFIDKNRPPIEEEDDMANLSRKMQQIVAGKARSDLSPAEEQQFADVEAAYLRQTMTMMLATGVLEARGERESQELLELLSLRPSAAKSAPQYGQARTPRPAEAATTVGDMLQLQADAPMGGKEQIRGPRTAKRVYGLSNRPKRSARTGTAG